MNENRKQWFAWLAVAVVIGLVATFLGVRYPVPPPPLPIEEGVEAKAVERGALLCATESGNCVESWNGSDLIVYSDAGSTQTYHVDGATGNVDAEGTGNFAGTLTAQGIVDIGTFLNLTPGAAEVVTAGSVIVPVASLQPITSTAAVTCSTTACITTTGFSTGDVLILRNDNAADVITIDGTDGTVECKTDVALGAADTLTLVFDGTDWNCISSYDNS